MRRPALVIGLCVFAACGDPVFPASRVDSLRVLAVRAEQPFARPGETDALEMLWYDGSPSGPRKVSVAWVAGCNNPPGDLYYECYRPLHATLDTVSDDDLAAERASSTVSFGQTYSAVIPADIISSRPRAPDVYHPYGLSYVFFAACPGTLYRQRDRMDRFPFACRGAADFVIGYYPIYVYDDVRNANPILRSVSFDGNAVGAACALDTECAGGQACRNGACGPSVKSCAAENRDDCPAHVLNPDVDPASVELARSAQVADDRAPTEMLWAQYYATRGDITKDARIINDPDVGPYASYETGWRAPAEPGTAKLWVVVHDNRGGTAWAEVDVAVE